MRLQRIAEPRCAEIFSFFFSVCSRQRMKSILSNHSLARDTKTPSFPSPPAQCCESHRLFLSFRMPCCSSVENNNPSRVKSDKRSRGSEILDGTTPAKHHCTSSVSVSAPLSWARTQQVRSHQLNNRQRNALQQHCVAALCR